MSKYLSNRQKNLKVGIESYTENLTSLSVVGKVGIGTTNASTDLDFGEEYLISQIHQVQIVMLLLQMVLVDGLGNQ
jgi:hypothetical protein